MTNPQAWEVPPIFWHAVFKSLYSDLQVDDETTREFELASFSSGQVATPLENESENPTEIPSDETNSVLSCSTPFLDGYLTIIPGFLADDVLAKLGNIFANVVLHQGMAMEALFEKNLSQDQLVRTREQVGRSVLSQSHT